MYNIITMAVFSTHHLRLYSFGRQTIRIHSYNPLVDSRMILKKAPDTVG